MSFEEFAAAHAGQSFDCWSDLAADAQACGLSDADRQRVYAAWRRVWSAAARGVTLTGWDRIKRSGVKHDKTKAQEPANG